MKHYMHFKEKPFQSIWEGNKTIELRLYDEKRRAVKVGDQIWASAPIAVLAEDIFPNICGVGTLICLDTEKP